jgi:hypothetical protein
MTEAEWLEGTEYQAILDYAYEVASERHLRLFACAVCRLIPGYMESEEDRKGLELTELDVDGLAPEGGLDDLGDEDWDIRWYRREGWDASIRAIESYMATDDDDPLPTSSEYCAWLDMVPKRGALSEIMREIIGNPFRPVVIHPARLTWADGTVPRLARVIYDERAFDRLPILADALTDAGCTDEALLAHLRSPGPHVRGCWPVDLILGLG